MLARLFVALYGDFRKSGVPYFAVLIIRILLYLGCYIRVPYFSETPLSISLRFSTCVFYSDCWLMDLIIEALAITYKLLGVPF